MTDDPIVGATIDSDEAFCSACGKSYRLELDTCPADGTTLTKLRATPDALLGRVFEGRYAVRSTLGHGGMGTVYRGVQLSVDREVAIKVIHTKLATDRTAVKRFLREARLSSRLSQPNIVNVYDFGQTDDGILYIVMELLRGHALSRELETQHQAMPVKQVLTIALQLCDALDAAHGQDIIHRDLKPGNIVLLDDPPGRDLIKVLDFGLAKTLTAESSTQVTNSNALLGTPLYMAPEQVECKATDQRTDLYALGCLLYHMVAGVPPFTGASISAVLSRHVNEVAAPLPATTPPALAAIVAQLIEKDPAKRIQSAAAVRAALLTVESSVTLASPSVPYRAPIAVAVTAPAGGSATRLDLPRRSRRPIVVVVAGLAVAAVIGVVIAGSSSRSTAPIDAAAVIAPIVAPDAAIDAVAPDAPVDAPVDASPDAALKRRPPPRVIDASDDPGFIKPDP